MKFRLQSDCQIKRLKQANMKLCCRVPNYQDSQTQLWRRGYWLKNRKNVFIFICLFIYYLFFFFGGGKGGEGDP